MREAIGIILLLTFVWYHYQSVEQVGLKKYYFVALGLKIMGGIAVGLVYKYYYLGGDTWTYFHQAQKLANLAFYNWENFTDLIIDSNYHIFKDFAYINQPRAAFMVKLVALVNVATNTNYWITSAYFSIFSFFGVWAFSCWVYKSFTFGKVASVALFIWPSFVFWGSGILKESVAVGLILWIIAVYFQQIESKSVRKLPLLLIALYLLFLIKYYFAVVLLVVLLVYAIMQLTPLHKRGYFQQFLAWLLLLSVASMIGGLLHPNLAPHSILKVIVANNQSFINLSNTRSTIHFLNASPEWIWLLINAPKALFAGLFLPLGFNKESIAFSISSIENWVMAILFIRALYNVKFAELKPRFTLLMASFSYVIVSAIFLALSTPNLGTLSRYKVAYLPIFLVLIVCSNKFNKPKENLNLK